MKRRIVLVVLALALGVACGPRYVRTRSLGPESAFVSGQLDDAAHAELKRRATESCKSEMFEIYCTEPRPDGVVVHWSCSYPKVLPPCPPPAP